MPVALLALLALAAFAAASKRVARAAPLDQPASEPEQRVDINQLCADRSGRFQDLLWCNPLRSDTERAVAFAEFELRRMQRARETDWWDPIEVFVTDTVSGVVRDYVVPAGLGALAVSFPAAAPAIALAYEAYERR